MSLTDRGIAFASAHLGHIAACRPLPGATSTSVYAVEGERASAVLRLFTNERWLAIEPDLARHEAAVLELVAGHEIDAPELIDVDPDGSVAGVPAILMSMLPGTPTLEPADEDSWLAAQLEQIASIGAIDASGLGWRYRPWFEESIEMPPTWSQVPEQWLTVHEAATARPLPEASGLVHRDYHPGNLLWVGDRLSGVVDWVNGCRGAIEIDVTGCAVDVGLLLGSRAAFDFVRRWERMTGAAVAIQWLAAAVIEMGEPGVVKQAWDALGTVRPLRWYHDQLDGIVAGIAAERGE